MLGSAERGNVRLISLEVMFQELTYNDKDTLTLQTDRQTDRQLALAIPRYAMLRAVKK